MFYTLTLASGDEIEVQGRTAPALRSDFPHIGEGTFERVIASRYGLFTCSHSCHMSLELAASFARFTYIKWRSCVDQMQAQMEKYEGFIPSTVRILLPGDNTPGESYRALFTLEEVAAAAGIPLSECSTYAQH
jgi:hypothetical protein